MTRRTTWLLLGAMGFVAIALVLTQKPESTVGGPPVEARKPAPIADSVTPEPPSTPAPVATDAEPAGVVMTQAIIDPETDKPLIEPLPLQQGELAWEARIRAVLTPENMSDAAKARALFNILPSISAEGAETCADEAIKRVTNADYQIAQPTVINSSTYGLAAAVLFADLMDRPDEIRLPNLVAIARNSAHPYASPARDNLELLLGKDYGTDWGKWDGAVREKLGKR